MESLFHISLHIKTLTGFETYGTFNLGNDQQKAKAIFEQLHGSEEVSVKTMLCMDLVKMQDGIPQPLKLLHCTLDDMATNMKIITCEVFKMLDLEIGKLKN